MIKSNIIRTSIIIGSLALATIVSAEESSIEAQKAAYPLKTCIVSDEALGGADMGAPIDYIHKFKAADGKESSRLIRLCCKSCVKTFKKDPEKYLSKLDAAAKQ